MSKVKYRLPKEFGEQWLTALRSGKYEQTKEMLYRKVYDVEDRAGYCCLGVAGAICGYSIQQMNNVSDLRDLLDEGVEEETDNIMDPDTSIPSELIPTLAGTLAYKCINMNDTENKSFSEIADWLEENVEFY